MTEKKKYIVAFIGEGEVRGSVYLTDHEAEIARYVLGLNGKWDEVKEESWSPRVLFDVVEDDIEIEFYTPVHKTPFVFYATRNMTLREFLEIEGIEHNPALDTICLAGMPLGQREMGRTLGAICDDYHGVGEQMPVCMYRLPIPTSETVRESHD